MVLDLAYTLELPKAFKTPNFSAIWTSGNTSLDVAYLSRALVLHAGGNKEELELASFGILHPELGVCFVENWWPVSKQVVSSIRRYHSLLSGSATSSRVSRFINCANQDANNHEIRNGVSPYLPAYPCRSVKNG